MNKVYFGRPFTGCEYKEVADYYLDIRIKCSTRGIKPIIPFTLTESLNEEGNIPDVEAIDTPELSDSAIVSRDKFLLLNSDMLVMDFTMDFNMPVGCLYELAWAHDWNKHTIVIMSNDNKMNRLFVRECADVVVETLVQALEYIEELVDV